MSERKQAESSIYSTQLAVEAHFDANWTGDIFYANTEKRPKSNEWIAVEVAPVFTESGISGCAEVLYVIHITAYGKTRVKSAHLADKVIPFLSGMKLAGSVVGVWRPVAQGPVFNGLHFRKMSFPLTVTTRCCF